MIKEHGLFDLPYSIEEASLVLIPVPWEATTSYGGGTSKGPSAIRDASVQVDLYDSDLGHFYEKGIAMAPESSKIRAMNRDAKKKAQKIIRQGGELKSKADHLALKKVNDLGEKLNSYVYDETIKAMDMGKAVGIVGGDHSVPLGAIKAHSERHADLGILHIDAHADLRIGYQGFKYSHASIMYNVLEQTSVNQIVQVGIRDFCEQENDVLKKNSKRMKCFFDKDLKIAQYQGRTWDSVVQDIVLNLPEKVYISFDIDGLDPRYCPSTGTPVPGGLDFDQAVHILRVLCQTKRKIVGFDLNEVAPGPSEWDANVGARMLFKLCGWTLQSMN